MKRVNLENMIQTIYLDGIRQEIEQQVKASNLVNIEGEFKVVDMNGNPVANNPTIDDSFFHDFH